MKIIAALIIVLFSVNPVSSQTSFQKDFTYYWQTIHDNFAYFDRQQINWDKTRTIYQPIVDTISNRESFIHLMEKLNNELYNGHVFLNTNAPSSNRMIPSGADMKVEYIHQQFEITALRPGFNAEGCGLKKGMIITKFNGQPISDAVKMLLPRSPVTPGKEMIDYAATLLLAGTHDTKRKITVRLPGKEQDFQPDAIANKTESEPADLLETKLLSGNIGYIRINNSLGNSDLIQAFDLALDSYLNTNGLVLDLRETPSGGTSTIARAIMGRFIDKELPYQKHIYTAEEKETGIRRTTLELVSPRGKLYRKPLILLVSYWTGSMGEGMAIGFEAMKRASIAGTKMAGLLGEIYSFETPELKIPFSFPTVQLQTINGKPREDFIPGKLIDDQDNAVRVAQELLKKQMR